ncbi:amidoligase family protein [Anaeroselena agilis]|uniref:Amidoligase family protein n=1 Tax=Anaeroselena agilis TaxID=3063788 RepID=A0ABU3NVC6_9FIRM|nr:amidoligase family protein [Selenomonadales bacterium 4137-cl]
MKNQHFGIEIEMTGLTREAAANVIAKYFGTHARYVGGCYKEYHVADAAGRTWKVVYDSSIRAEKKVSGGTATAGDDHKVEMVSPKCNYADINDIQELVRLIRKAGGIVNSSCGIHVHVDAANHNAKSLRNLVNIMASKDELIYKALEVDSARESRFCKKVDGRLVAALKAKKPATMDAVKNIWYAPYGGDGSYQHYHSSRYHGLNLHSVFQKGTVEFRLFNSTLHAGKIKAYIQFCLAVSHQAIAQKSASATPTVTYNPAYTFRCWLLRLGMIGDEFKTARLHLMAKMEGNSAWRNANHR